MLKEKISAYRSLCRCKIKGSNQCGTELKHNMLSISAGEIKIKRYQNHSKHWSRDECYLSALYYEVKIEAHKKYEVIII